MSERNLEIIREYHFDPKEVIKGLNGYYESDKCNSYIYITIRRNDVECPAYCTAALYLSALIEWLRVDHDIFYRPGLTPDQIEAARSAAKMCGLRAHIKDEISKRGLRCDKDADIPALVDTLFKAYDEEGERADENRKEVVKLSKENRELKSSQKSDTNKLIREYCTEHGIVAPSRYLSDEACIEYLFSVSFAILQDLYRDIFKRQPDGLSAEDIANKILDRVLETEDLLHKSVDSVNKECKATGKLMVEAYKIDLKDYILKDIKEHGYRYDGLQTKSIEEIVDWIITMATLDRSSIALRDIYTTVASPVERRRYNIDNCDGAIVDHMKDYILRRFEGLRINIEYCLKKMSELDGCKKDLKILEEQQEFLVKQNSELSCKICAKDGEISRLKDLINAMNEEVKDM